MAQFVKYATETPKALVYTDLARWNSCNSAYFYFKSIRREGGAVLLEGVLEDNKDYPFLDAETILKHLQDQDPSLPLMVDDCYGEEDPVDRAEVDEVLEYDAQDPKEIFFNTDTGYEEDDW